MSRLADELLVTAPRLAGGGYNPPEAARALVLRDLAQQLGEAEVFVIDNVAEYWDRSGGSAGQFRFEDFPNVAPPFPQMFVEWALRDETGRQADANARLGVLMTTLKDDPETGWTVELAPFLGERNWTVGPIDVMYILVDESGRLTDLRGPADADASRTPEMANSHWHLILPALLAVCFLHCRNVTRQVVRPSPKITAARARRGRRPFLTYKLLRIEPMTEVLRTQGGAETAGLVRALHICRGHFKTYQERPLFGRLRGTWWWADHVRGAVEAGVVSKDYEIGAPTASIAEVGESSRRRRGTRRS